MRGSSVRTNARVLVLLNEEEPYHSFEDPFEDGEVRFQFYTDDNHVIIHYMESIPEECGYAEPIVSSGDSDKENLNPMEITGWEESSDSWIGNSTDPTSHMEYQPRHQELVDHLIKAAHQAGREADMACQEDCRCKWHLDWDME